MTIIGWSDYSFCTSEYIHVKISGELIRVLGASILDAARRHHCLKIEYSFLSDMYKFMFRELDRIAFYYEIEYNIFGTREVRTTFEPPSLVYFK